MLPNVTFHSHCLIHSFAFIPVDHQVVKEENIKSCNSKTDRLLCTTPNISLQSEDDDDNKVHANSQSGKDAAQSDIEKEGDDNANNQLEQSVGESDTEAGGGDNVNNSNEQELLAQPDEENDGNDIMDSQNRQDEAQPDIEEGGDGDETGILEDTITGVSSYAKKLSMVSDVSNDDLLMLPRRVSPQPDTVPNTCAICFESYKPGDTVAWSNNRQCIHAFHLDCVLEYLVLVKSNRRVPCPTCRQTFTTFSIKKSNPKQKSAQHGVHHG